MTTPEQNQDDVERMDNPNQEVVRTPDTPPAEVEDQAAPEVEAPAVEVEDVEGAG